MLPVATMPIRINVRQATGDIFPIEIDDSCTVRELKDKVEGKCRVKACHQELMSRKPKMTLDDDLLLSDCALVGGETIELTDLSSASIPIKLVKGTETVTFQQGNLTTIKELRAKVVELTDGSPKEFGLGFGDNLLVDRTHGKDMTFGDYNIRTGCKDVTVLVRTGGGALSFI